MSAPLSSESSVNDEKSPTSKTPNSSETPNSSDTTNKISRLSGNYPTVMSLTSPSSAKSNDNVMVKAVLTRVGSGVVAVAGVRVDFYIYTPNRAARVGTSYTGNDGSASVNFRPGNFVQAGEAFYIAGEFAGNGVYSGSLPVRSFSVK